MAKQILTKINDELRKMKDSRDEGYVATYIPWNRNRGFSVECNRLDEDFNAYDEDGRLVEDNTGVPVEYQVYYLVDGRDEDCCTLSSFLFEDDMQSLKEFMNIYR